MESENNKIIMAWGDVNGKGKTTLQDLENYKDHSENHKDEIADFVYWRLYERYIAPSKKLINLKGTENSVDTGQHNDDSTKEGPTLSQSPKLRIGFSIMANMCLLIETLQSFKEGLGDSKRKSGRLFNNFWNTKKYLEDKFFNISKEDKEDLQNSEIGFYKNVRCAILHQGETTGEWRINHGEKAIDTSSKLIDAAKFLDVMEVILEDYQNQLKKGVGLSKCKDKIECIIENCDKPNNNN